MEMKNFFKWYILLIYFMNINFFQFHYDNLIIEIEIQRVLESSNDLSLLILIVIRRKFIWTYRLNFKANWKDFVLKYALYYDD